MSNFKPRPLDGENHCDSGCELGQACFLYDTGTICQPFTYPPTYPATGPNTTIVDPPGWYIYPGYPSIRYTGSLANQTEGAPCTTVPIPHGSSIYSLLINMARKWDFGWFTTILDQQSYSAMLLQNRGNCAENFYCRSDTAVNSSMLDYTQGSLPGTCQPLKALGDVCVSSTMCMGWHINADGTFSDDQVRCQPHPVRNGTLSGVCTNIGVGKGSVRDQDQDTGRSAWTYLLSTLIFVGFAILYLWYRRQKLRRNRMAMAMSNGYANGNNGPSLYVRRGGVNRQPDDNDNGDLPAYGMHRRDERVTGLAAEEIGMYAFSNGGPQPASMAPNAPYPPTSVRPVNQSYPFPMTHPGLNSVLNQPQPPGTFYPPPPMDPAPLTSQEAEAAAIRAAAAAAMPTPSPAAARLPGGNVMPPAYESSPAHSTAPSVAPRSESSAVTDTTIVNSTITGAAAAATAQGTVTEEVASDNNVKAGKQEFSGDISSPFSKEKSSSSTGPESVGESGSSSGVSSISGSSPKNKEQ